MTGISLERAKREDAKQLAAISKRAFDSDSEVGAPGPGGPPGYNSLSSQLRFMKFLDYYKILLDETIVGGIFVSSKRQQHRILERIFVDPPYHNQGIGSQAMTFLWNLYPDVQLWTLGTPEWNMRTQRFYEKLGFIQVGWENVQAVSQWRGIWYQKEIDPLTPYKMINIGKLQDGLKDVTVEGVVLSISSPREVKSRSTGKPLSVANAELGDPTGKILLVLWNEQISQVNVDDKIRVEYGSVSSYQGVVQLNIGWIGHLITLI